MESAIKAVETLRTISNVLEKLNRKSKKSRRNDLMSLVELELNKKLQHEISLKIAIIDEQVPISPDRSALHKL